MTTEFPRPDDGNSTSDDPAFAELVDRLDRLWEQVPQTSASVSNLQFGKYRIIDAIGSGAFGVVYRAQDTELQREVALKLPRPEVLCDPERLRRFRTEATTAATLSHASIVPIYEADLNGPTPFIASSLCNGPDLGRWLQGRTEPVPAKEAASFVATLGDAVHYAHENGVFHRDLKPGNILLESVAGENQSTELSDLQPRLTDFGLAKLLEASLQDTRSSLLVGTPLYMAPEQLSSQRGETSAATDVYGLGVILFELLTLRTPFEGSSYVAVLDKVRTAEPPRIRDLNSTVPRELETICQKCLAKEPTDRYHTAAALADDLNRFLSGQPLLARPVTWHDRFHRWCRQPERLRQAGAFTCSFQSAIIMWVLIVLFFGWLSQEVPREVVRESIYDIIFVTIVFHLPLIGCGAFLVCGKRWPYWPAAIGSAVLLMVVVYSGIQPAVAFEYNFPTTVSKLNTFVGLGLGSFIQTALYGFAFPAWLILPNQVFPMRP